MLNSYDYLLFATCYQIGIVLAKCIALKQDGASMNIGSWLQSTAFKTAIFTYHLLNDHIFSRIFDMQQTTDWNPTIISFIQKIEEVMTVYFTEEARDNGRFEFWRKYPHLHHFLFIHHDLLAADYEKHVKGPRKDYFIYSAYLLTYIPYLFDVINKQVENQALQLLNSVGFRQYSARLSEMLQQIQSSHPVIFQSLSIETLYTRRIDDATALIIEDYQPQKTVEKTPPPPPPRTAVKVSDKRPLPKWLEVHFEQQMRKDASIMRDHDPQNNYNEIIFFPDRQNQVMTANTDKDQTVAPPLG